MKKEIEKDTKKFFKAVDDLIYSKFVLVDKMIGNVLTEIASSKTIYNLIAEYSLSFNFENEFKLSTETGKFYLPADNTKILPFVFCLLTNFDEQKINIASFIDKYYSGDEKYTLFLHTVILPFKNAALSLLDDSNVEEESIEIKKSKLTDDIISRLTYLIKSLKNKIIADKKLVVKGAYDDCQFILDCMLEEVKYKNTNAIVTLFMTLKYVIKNKKKNINELSDMKEIIDIIK